MHGYIPENRWADFDVSEDNHTMRQGRQTTAPKRAVSSLCLVEEQPKSQRDVAAYLGVDYFNDNATTSVL